MEYLTHHKREDESGVPLPVKGEDKDGVPLPSEEKYRKPLSSQGIRRDRENPSPFSGIRWVKRASCVRRLKSLSPCGRG
jgi:hypothetical protein